MDLNDIPLFKAMTRRMGWLGERQQLLAQNVANADTPNYVSRDLKTPSFRDLVNGTSSHLQLAATQPSHLSGVGSTSPFRAETDRNVQLSPSGNGVSVEEQMLKVSATANEYQLMTNLYRRHIAMVKTVLARSA